MNKKIVAMGALLALPVFAFANNEPAVQRSSAKLPVVAEISAVVRSTIDPDGMYVNGVTDIANNMNADAQSDRVIGEGENAKRIETTVEMEASLWRTAGTAYRVEWESSLRAVAYENGWFKVTDKIETVSAESTVSLQPGETKTFTAGNCRKAESVEERCTFEIKIALKPLSPE